MLNLNYQCHCCDIHQSFVRHYFEDWVKVNGIFVLFLIVACKSTIILKKCNFKKDKSVSVGEKAKENSRSIEKIQSVITRHYRNSDQESMRKENNFFFPFQKNTDL